MHFGILAATAAAALVLFAAPVDTRRRQSYPTGTGAVGECFEGEGVSLGSERLKESDFMSQDVCLMACDTSVTDVFALNAERCFCGKRTTLTNKFKSVDMSKCMVSCPGDPLQACGSADNMLVMTIADSRRLLMPDDAVNDTFKYTEDACYMYTGQLFKRIPFDHKHMSHSYCALHCLRTPLPSGRTVKYFGLMGGNKCYCSHEPLVNPSEFYVLDQKKSEFNFCRSFCPGSISQYCGGTRAMLVFQFGDGSISTNGSASVNTVNTTANATKPDKGKNCSKRCCSGSCLHWCAGILAMLIFKWNN